MNATSTRKPKQPTEEEGWPRLIPAGRETVSVYRRKTPSGNFAFMVANNSSGKRRFDCYSDEAEALEAADVLAKRLSKRDVLAASITKDQAIEFASATQTLEPFKVSLTATATTMAECLKIAGDLPNVLAAVKFHAVRNKRTIAKRVSEVVAELLKIKEARGASGRYMQDLRYRLNRFAESFQKDACNVTTAEIQEWLDNQKLKPQGYTNFRRVLHLLFKFAVARGYAADNPVEGAERVKVRNGDVEIFTPSEIARLLAAASPDFLPSLAIGAFSGLRSAEIERLEWSDIDLVARHIIVGASRAKTASRRIVPIHDNLAAWLTPYAEKHGKVWPGGHDEFYERQQETAAATKGETKAAMKWKANALRHSYASYRFAQTGDAGRVAGECGNSAAVIHKHYRELVKPADAEKWFNVSPEPAENIIVMSAAAR